MLSIGANDTVIGLWATTAGGGGTLATPGWGAGNYVPIEPPTSAFDSNCSTKYTNYGMCSVNVFSSAPTCGLQTGFTLTLQRGATVIKALRFCTGNDHSPRDPSTMTLEGSNQNGSTLLLGSSWTLIYNGTTGLDVDPGRGNLGMTQTFYSNAIAYSSYRILITMIRGSDVATQYSELQLFAFWLGGISLFPSTMGNTSVLFPRHVTIITTLDQREIMNRSDYPNLSHLTWLSPTEF